MYRSCFKAGRDGGYEGSDGAAGNEMIDACTEEVSSSLAKSSCASDFNVVTEELY